MGKVLVYQMWPIAYNSIEKMTKQLKYAKDLCADYVWLSPIYPSPKFDHGYDISDYMGVDVRFGTMQDFDTFVATAHGLGIKVLMDLVLNHTSTHHRWFRKHPDYYCWEKSIRKGWKNLFDGGLAWEPDPKMGACYLHLFHKEQADLNWFPRDRLNRSLVHEFRNIVQFWLKHQVDGFRLDVPQSINKDFSSDRLEFSDLLFGNKAIKVINAIFSGFPKPKTYDGKRPFLIMECFDPTYGEIIGKYVRKTPVDFVMNMMLKSEIDQGLENFKEKLALSTKNPHFMLDLESHDAPRFTSRSRLPVARIAKIMFESGAKGICVYQGQELGLTNPSKARLPDDLLLKLDAETAMRHSAGVPLDQLRPLSRANARIPLPMEKYKVPHGTFKLFCDKAREWKKR